MFPFHETFLAALSAAQTKEGLMPFYSFRFVLLSFLQNGASRFAAALREEDIEQAFEEEGVSFAQEEGDIYTPPITLWAFLSQVLFKGEQRSCIAAVSRIIVLLVSLSKEPPSDNTGAYCRARAKLPVAIIRRLTLQAADQCEEQVPSQWLWKGRHVQLVDGTTVTMPDTPANQAEYPQSSQQAEGLGFPIARMVVLLSLATAMVSGMAMGPYAGKETGETALLRELFDCLKPGDVLLADRCYGSYFMIALLVELDVDVVVRQHQSRKTDFRRGQRLGRGDHIVEWRRPAKPEWMDQETYEHMPEVLRMREVQVQVNQPGFRVESLVVVTTLTEADVYTRDDIAELYHKRWLVELDLRSIKISLDMDMLRCKSPEMVRREIWTCLLAYNLIRKTMLESALQAGRSPRQLSFAAAMQKIAASWNAILICDDRVSLILIEVHLEDMATHEVGHRPNRVEPRAKKRRPKAHPLLTQPREQARAALLG